VIYGYDKGAALFDGTAAPARRVHFFMGDATYASLNAAGLSLFDAALNWAVGLQAPAGRPTLSVTRAAGTLLISWQGSGFRLQQSTDLTTWTDVAGVVGTQATVQSTGNYRFYRLVQ
jgi:hypothetical protein